MTGRILEALRDSPQGFTLTGLARRLDLSQEERPALRAALRELEDEGAVWKTGRRYFWPSGSRLVRGRVISVGRGFAFVRPDESGPDLYVRGRSAGNAARGDGVELFVGRPGSRGKAEGRVVRVTERRHETLLGVIKERWGRLVLQPYDSPRMEDVPIRLRPGQRIETGTVAEVDRDTCEVRAIMGDPDSPGVDLAVIARRFELSPDFSSAALSEARAVSGNIPEEELRRRVDLRDWAAVTIDGPDARDFDDAVSIRRRGRGGWELGVHIADVAFYVRPGTALDREARARGNSVYFPERAFHMLPENLSEDVCSLRPGEDRLAVSVRMSFAREGRVEKILIQPSVIRSRARLTYDEVQELFQGGNGFGSRFPGLEQDLLVMRELALILRETRRRRGGLDLQKPEPRLVYDGERMIGVEPRFQEEAHRLIEEFMIAANEAVAGFFRDRQAPLLFRVHPPPKEKDLEELKERLGRFGIGLPPPDRIGVKDLQAVLDQARARPESAFVSILVLRSMRLAVYAVKNTGHFGLGTDLYTHFTSPIRRYPDLTVHRSLHALLSGGAGELSRGEETARHCSERERLADEAERALVEWRILRYLKTRLGDEVEGFVAASIRSGLLIELPRYFVSGIMFREDFAGTGPIPGSGGAPALSPGDPVRVVLAAVNPDLRRIVLVPASRPEGGGRD